MTDNSNVTSSTAQSANNSTLIEFPGVNRNRPAWRKELSERFREIQQRRARDSDTQGDEPKQRQSAPPTPRPAANAARADSYAQPSDPASKQLGLVPAPDEPALNPIVAKALRRVERARAAASAPRQGGGRGHAATAAARVFDEEVESTTAESVAAAPQPERSADAGAAHAKHPARRAEKIENEGDAARPTPLVVVQPKQPTQAEQQKHEVRAGAAIETAAVEAKAPARAAAGTVSTPEAASLPETLKKHDASPVAESAARTSHADAQAEGASRQPRHIDGVLDEFWLERQGIELLPKVEATETTYDDRAPRTKRLAGGLVDLLVVAFLSAPFAAGIELTISNWNDPRVSGSMALIVALVIFLYQTCSVALAGRTFGMSLCALHAVDARRASVPTTGQCMRRAVVYILSLATLGLGLLYSLFDADGRTVHDILSGTVVVRK